MQTDQQLAEIYQNAASKASQQSGRETGIVPWVMLENDTRASRTEGIRAVREAMDKEYEAELEKLKNEHTMEFIQLNHALPISRDGGLKIIDHAIATVNDLTAEVAKHDEEITRLTAIIEQAIEMVNTPGTTKDNLPKAINAKIMQRDEFHDATLKKLDAAKEDIARLLRLDATNRDNLDRMNKALVEAQVAHVKCQAQLAQTKIEIERMKFDKWWKQANPDDGFTCGEQAAAWSAWKACAALSPAS